jgi:hypothetical protein
VDGIAGCFPIFETQLRPVSHAIPLSGWFDRGGCCFFGVAKDEATGDFLLPQSVVARFIAISS